MTIEELEQLADKAIERWQNPPRLPGELSVKICSPTKTLELLPGLKAAYLGKNNNGLSILLVDAKKLKQAIERFRQEFVLDLPK